MVDPFSTAFLRTHLAREELPLQERGKIVGHKLLTVKRVKICVKLETYDDESLPSLMTDLFILGAS